MGQQPVSLRGVQLLPVGPSSPLLLMSNCLLCVPVRDSTLGPTEVSPLKPRAAGGNHSYLLSLNADRVSERQARLCLGRRMRAET